MSGSRLLDDLARALVEPVPRRRALRLLGAAAAAVVLPVGRPGVAGAADGTRTCQNVKGEIWPCPLRKYMECGVNKGECLDQCVGPGKLGCGSGAGFDCCIDPFGRDGYLICPNKRCVPSCKAIEQTVSAAQKPLTQCGELCCHRGEKCSFSRVAGRSTRVCCPVSRVVSREIAGKQTRFCCPSGTVSSRGSCCPPGRPGCCDGPVVDGGGDDDLTPLSPFSGRTFCVRGKPRRL